MRIMRPKILIVEDDHALRDVLRRALSDDFDPVMAADGATALRLVTADVAAAVVDIGLPDADGRDVCQAMRANGFPVPVIFLTARHRISDRLSGFSAGGDDYLPKPFHLAELAARLKAVLKRSAHRPVASHADLELDAVNHCLSVDGGARVDLSPTEFRLLATLVAAHGGIVRRLDLVRSGWPEGAHVSDNTLDQYLTRLRRKLRDAGSGLTITTARGVGHRLS